MESIVMILVLIAGLVRLDVAALSWGADTRDRLPDDHTR